MDQSRDHSDLTGREVSHFRVLEPLGAGGMGVVYRAEDLRLHRTVALKFMRPDYTVEDTATARFLREARSVAALDHPNICTVHEVGETEDGQLFLAMSYYTGETLRERLTEHGSLAPREALDIAAQIARGLAAAHGAGIIHRDLKPANVMLTADGMVKILDFGLAKSRDQTMTATGAVMGTVAYMSPEQIIGDTVDARSDLWSLGVVLFEMLTGRHPSRSDDATATLTRNLAAQAVPVRPDASAALAQLLERLLRKNPAERYQSATELLTDLAGLREELTGTAASPARRGRRLTRWRLMTGTSAVMLATVLFVALQSRPARPLAEGTRVASNARGSKPSVAVLPLKNYAGADQDYVVEGMTDELTTTLSKIDALHVIAYQSMLQFRRSVEPVSTIARRVDAKYLVDGSVRADSSRIRINASLIDAARSTSIWSQAFDADRRDVLTLQRNIALEIARAIEVTLTPRDTSRLAAPRSVDPKAYGLYVQGTQARYAANFTADFRESTRLFEESIARDSTFAYPYAGLAFNYAFAMDETRARQMADKAVELDPRLADGYVARSIIKQFFEWDWRGAEEAVRKAIEMNPGHAEAHHELSMLLSRLGRYREALSEAVLALSNNPLSLRFENGLAEVHLFGGKSDEALALADAIARKDSTFLGPHFLRSVAYLQKDSYREAERELIIGCRRHAGGGHCSPGYFAYVYAKTNREAKASQIVDSLKTLWRQESGKRSAWSIAADVASAYAGLGNRDSALTWLERAAELKTQLLYVKVDPTYASLRSEPRYRALLERMRFPEP